MGSSFCCQADSERKHALPNQSTLAIDEEPERTKDPTEGGDPLPVPGEEKPTGSLLKSLQGRWKRISDNFDLGEVLENEMVWNPIFKTPATALHEVGKSTIKMTLNGDTHTGEYNEERVTVHWSDGEVWSKA